MDKAIFDEIIEKIKTLAPVYAPEWKFDPDNRDIGTALALIFAKQLTESIERFEEMPENHKAAFYNILGASLLPALPSSGILCFSVPENLKETDGFLIPKSFLLFSPPVGDDGKRYYFETTEEFLLSPAVISEIFFTDFEKDCVSFWDKNSSFSPDNFIPCSHTAVFSHEYIDKATNKTQIFLTVKAATPKRWIENLLNSKTSKWILHRELVEKDDQETEEKEPETELLTAILKEQDILLCGFSKMPYKSSIELMITDKTEFEKLSPATSFEIYSKGFNIPPDGVFANGEEQELHKNIYLFGEMFSPGNTAIFLCDNVLSRFGAEIHLTFTVGFSVVKTENPLDTLPLPKKFILTKQSIQNQKIPDIIIENTAFEYWNGLGFSPLKTFNFSGHLFAGLTKEGAEIAPFKAQLSFICPLDIAPFLAGSKQGFCIRARVREQNNMYVRPARVFVPYIKDIVFNFKCKPSPVKIGYLENDFVKTTLAKGIFFKGNSYFKNEKTALYIGFDTFPGIGNIKMFVVCKGEKPVSPLSFYTLSGKDRNVIIVNDKTSSFTETGLISFNITENFKKTNIYGRECFFIVACFTNTPHKFEIEKIYMNSTAVLQCKTITNERFYREKNINTFNLKFNNILDLKLSAYNSKASEMTKRPDSKDFKEIPENLYTVDFSKGEITLSREFSDECVIKADYRYGGGTIGNFPAWEDFTPSYNTGYFGKITNPLPITGGTDTEKPHNASIRFGKTLRIGNRPVTASDYADFLLEPNIAAVKCFYKENEPGIDIVILAKDYKAPYVFTRIKENAEEKLKKVLPLGCGKVDIIPPIFISVNIEAHLVVEREKDLKTAYTALRDLCDPQVFVKTKDFGACPTYNEIYETLTSLLKVKRCTRLFVKYFDGEKQIKDIPAFALPICDNITLFAD